MGDVAARFGRNGARLVDTLARRRVTLGFVAAVATVVVATPAWPTWRAGLVVALVGEAIRIWAAGHLEKGREVTRSGPYRWTRHPLYAGSALIALGVVIASRSVSVGVVVALYMSTTIAAAVRTEEAFLRRQFGDAYDRYRRSEDAPMARRFSFTRALKNREYRAVIGLVLGFGVLAAKIVLL